MFQAGEPYHEEVLQASAFLHDGRPTVTTDMNAFSYGGGSKVKSHFRSALQITFSPLRCF